MAKLVDDTVLDAALGTVDNATSIIVASGTPTSYAEAVANALATGNAGNSKAPTFAAPADDTSGRKLVVNEVAGIPIAANGTPTHICLIVGTTLLYQTTCTGAALVTGNTVTVPAWKINIPDPT